MSSYYSRHGRLSAGSRVQESGEQQQSPYSSQLKSSPYSSNNRTNDSSLDVPTSTARRAGHRGYHRAGLTRNTPPLQSTSSGNFSGPIAPGELLVCPIDDDDDACSALTELTEQIPSPTSANRRGARASWQPRSSFRPSFMTTLNEVQEDERNESTTFRRPTERTEPRSADRLDSRPTPDRFEPRSEPRSIGSRATRRTFEPSRISEPDDHGPTIDRFRERNSSLPEEDNKPIVSGYLARRNLQTRIDETLDIEDQPTPKSRYSEDRDPPPRSRYLHEADELPSQGRPISGGPFEERRCRYGNEAEDLHCSGRTITGGPFDDRRGRYGNEAEELPSSARPIKGGPFDDRRGRYGNEAEDLPTLGRTITGGPFEERRGNRFHDDHDDSMSIHSSRDRLNVHEEDVSFNNVIGGRERSSPVVKNFEEERIARNAPRGDSSVYSHASRISNIRNSTSASRFGDEGFASPKAKVDTMRMRAQPTPDVEKYKQEVEELETLLNQKTEELKALEEKMQGLEHEMQERLDRREEEIDRMKRSEDQNKQDMKKIEERLKAAQEENLNLRGEITEIRQQLETSRNTERTNQVNIEVKNKLEEELKNEIDHLNQELDDVDQKFQELEFSHQEALKQLESNKDRELEDRTLELDDLKSQVITLEETVSKKEREITMLRQSEQGLRTTLDSCRVDSDQVERLERELRLAKEENESIRRMSQTYEASLKRNKTTIEGLENDLSSTKKHIKDIEQEKDVLAESGDHDRCVLERYRTTVDNLQRQLEREKRDKETMKSFLQSEIELLKKDKQRMSKDLEREKPELKGKIEPFNNRISGKRDISFERSQPSFFYEEPSEAETASTEWDNSSILKKDKQQHMSRDQDRERTEVKGKIEPLKRITGKRDIAFEPIESSSSYEERSEAETTRAEWDPRSFSKKDKQHHMSRDPDREMTEVKGKVEPYNRIMAKRDIAFELSESSSSYDEQSEAETAHPEWDPSSIDLSDMRETMSARQHSAYDEYSEMRETRSVRR